MDTTSRPANPCCWCRSAHMMRWLHSLLARVSRSSEIAVVTWEPLWGTPEFVSSFVESKVTDWTRQVSRLSNFTRTQPQAAYSAFVHGLQGKWSFLSRTLEISSKEFGGLEAIIRERLTPALTGRLSPSSVGAAYALVPLPGWRFESLDSLRPILPLCPLPSCY